MDVDSRVTIRFAAASLGWSEETARKWWSDKLSLPVEKGGELTIPAFELLREMTRQITTLQEGFALLGKKLGNPAA